jgi:hypothetical protein
MDSVLLFWPLLGLLVVASWLALGWWSASPYARLLGHGGWGDAERSPRCVAPSRAVTSSFRSCSTALRGC